MFFGSGNLVFPLNMGTETLDKFLYAASGLSVTGVLVPFLGLFAIILFNGDRKAFFSAIGKFPALLLTLFILALLGPIGVVPRCFLVAYGSVQPFLPETSFLAIFSAVFAAVTLLVIWNHHRVIPILGRLLTPWLLLGICSVVVMGLYFAPALETSSIQNTEAFQIGIFEGYQMMDLLAAFFFSAAIVEYLRSHKYIEDKPASLIPICTTAGLLAATLLGIIYFGFVKLGAQYSSALTNTPPEQMLVGIASLSLGPVALPIVAITVFLACLTTATILAMQFAEFFSTEITNGRIPRTPAILITLIISYFISLTGFSSLTAYLGQILTFAYPALIALTLTSILAKTLKFLPKSIPFIAFYGTLLGNLALHFLN